MSAFSEIKSIRTNLTQRCKTKDGKNNMKMSVRRCKTIDGKHIPMAISICYLYAIMDIFFLINVHNKMQNNRWQKYADGHFNLSLHIIIDFLIRFYVVFASHPYVVYLPGLHRTPIYFNQYP